MSKFITKKIYVALITLLCVGSSYAQQSTEGKEFLLAFGQLKNYTAANIHLEIKIAAKKATVVNIEFTANSVVNVINLPVAAGTIYTLVLSPAQITAAYNMYPGGTSNKSVRITSTENVSVYLLNQQVSGAASTNVFPVNALGTEYYHISYYPTSAVESDISEDYNDGYLIIAQENGTNVYVNGSSTPAATLNAGGVYNYYFPIRTDGTKTRITTNKPVAYFVTNSYCNIPRTYRARDPLFQQLPPVNQWGTKFFVPNTTQQMGRVRIMATRSGTNITLSPNLTPIDRESFNTTIRTGGQTSRTGLNAGQFIELEIGTAGCYITSNNPVGVCAYMVGNSYVPAGASLGAESGDPAIAWIPPIEQSMKEVLMAPFIPNSPTQITKHYALIVTPTVTKNQTSVAIGGAAPIMPAITWTDNASSGFSFGSLQLTQNTTYRFANPSRLVINGYGIGVDESYYFLAGAATRSLDIAFYVNDIHYQDLYLELFCPPVQFHAEISGDMSILPGFLKWYINNVEEIGARDQLTWSKNLASGTHQIKMAVLMDDNVTIKTVEGEIKVDSSGAYNDFAVAVSGKTASFPIQIDVLDNDYLYCCTDSAVLISIIETPTRGTATVTIDNKIEYTPISNYEGRDSLRYKIICNGMTDSAFVYITIAKTPDNIIPAGCYADPPQAIFSIKELSRSATEVSILTNPIAGDIDNDGEIEILVMNQGTPTTAAGSTAILIYGFNKITNSLYLKYKIPLPVNLVGFPYSPLAIAKVDANPYASVFYTSFPDRKLYKFDFNGVIPVSFPSTTSWTQSWATTYTNYSTYSVVSPTIADIMGNGRTQVVMLDKIIDTKTGNIIADGNLISSNAHNPNLSFGWFGHANSSTGEFESIPVVIDIDGDGIQEVIGGDCVYGVQLVNFDNPHLGNTFTLKMRVDKTGHAEVGDGGTAVADIDNCGELEVIVSGPVANGFSTATNSALYIYNPRTGVILNNNIVANIPRHSAKIYGPSRPFVGDFDDDGISEIAVTGYNTLRSYKYDKGTGQLNMLWDLPTTDESSSTTLTVFNFAQDGKNRLVYRDETQLRIIDASTVPPTVDAFFDNVESPTINEFPIIVDVNGDGAAEIIVTGVDIAPVNGPGTGMLGWYFAGELRVYASNGSPWAPSRKVWNQSAYNSLNINEDLTIPRFPMSPATVFPGKDELLGTADDVRPYNGYLMQQTILNQYGVSFWPMPNIIWKDGIKPTMVFKGDSVVVTGCIKNTGDAALVTPFYVTFYKNDTTTIHNAANKIGLDSIMVTLMKDSTYCFRLVLDSISKKTINSDTSIWISINDKGTGTYPYQAQCFVDGRREFKLDLNVLHQQVVTCYESTDINIIKLLGATCASPATVTVKSPLTTTLGATLTTLKDSCLTYKYSNLGLDTIKFTLSCSGGGTQSGMLIVTLVECPDNIIPAGCYADPPATEWSIKELDRTSVKVHAFAQPLVGDFDGCGKNEIVVFDYDPQYHNSDKLLIFDDQLQQKAFITIPTTFCYLSYPISIADVDRDGKAEIFVLTGNTANRTLQCYYYNGATWGAKPGFASSAFIVPFTKSDVMGMPSIVIGDINGDGIPELFVYDRIINSHTGAVIATLPSGSRGGISVYLDGHYVYYPVLADMDNDGILEIVAGNMVYKADINAGSTTGTVTLAYQAPAGADIEDGFTSVADIDLDGYLDVVVTHNENQVSRTYVWCPYKGTLLGQTMIGNANNPPQGSAADGNISRAFVGDVNNDGYPEIAFSYRFGMACFRYNAPTNNFVELWRHTTTDQSGMTTMTMFDFNQDGKQEIIYRDETHLRIIDGETGLNKESIFCYSATASEFPAVVDLSGEGYAQILVSGASDIAGEIHDIRICRYVSAIPGAWAPARKVWNQHGYNAVNINEDLTVPRYPINPATVFPGKDELLGTADDVRPFNGFLMQQTMLNQYGIPFWPMPNIVWKDGIEPTMVFKGDSVVVTGCIKNIGNAAALTPIYVAFYKNDSTTLYNTTNKIALDSIQVTLMKDSTYCFRIVLDSVIKKVACGDSSIWISINDKGTGTYPYQAQCFVDGRREFKDCFVPPTITLLKDKDTTCYNVEFVLAGNTFGNCITSVSLSTPNGAGTFTPATGTPLTGGTFNIAYMPAETDGGKTIKLVVTSSIPTNPYCTVVTDTFELWVHPAPSQNITYKVNCNDPPATTGTLVVTNPIAGSGYTYKLNNGAFQAKDTFFNVATGNTHTLTIKDVNGCTKTENGVRVACVAFKPTAANYVACPNALVPLSMQAVGGIDFYWYDQQINGTLLTVMPKDTFVVTKDGSNLQTWWVEPRQGSLIFDRIRIDLTLSQSCGGPVVECVEKGTLLFKEDFGGNSPSDPIRSTTPLLAGITNYTFEAGGASVEIVDGYYGIAKRTDSIFPTLWHKYFDHTYPNDSTRGYCMVVNADYAPGMFYNLQIDDLCPGTELYFSAWLGNLVNNPILTIEPDLRFVLQDAVTLDVLVDYVTGIIPTNLLLPEWKQYGFGFTAISSSVILTIFNNAPGGMGNDIVLDDIEVRICLPEVEVVLDNICGTDRVNLTASFEDDDKITNAGTLALKGYWIKSNTNDVNDIGLWSVVPGTDTTGLAGQTIIGSLLVTVPDNDTVYYRFVVGSEFTVNNPVCRAASAAVMVYKPHAPILKVSDTAVCSNASFPFNLKTLLNNPADSLQFSINNNFIPLIAPATAFSVNADNIVKVYVRVFSGDTNCIDSINLIVKSLPSAPLIDTDGELKICDGELINEELLSTRNLRIYTNPNVVLKFFLNKICTIEFSPFMADYRTTPSHTIYVRAEDTVTNCVSATDSIKVSLRKCNVRFEGTVIPFIYHKITGDESTDDLATKQFLNSAFPVIATLYAIPDYSTIDPVGAIALATPLFVDTAKLYTGSIWYDSIPKYPGTIMRNNNPGVKIHWEELIASSALQPINDTRLGSNTEIPEIPIGIYTFVDVPVGSYLLVLSRAGYVTRYAEVEIDDEGGFLGHRELIMGDIDETGEVTNNDMNEIIPKFVGAYISPVYDPKYDVTSNGKIDTWDVLSVKAHLGFNKRHYSDTRAWLLKYGL